jgi:hypothetical protein
MSANTNNLATLLFSACLAFVNPTFAECPTISIDSVFATKAPSGAEANKAPTYVPSDGGYLPDEKIACKAGKVNFKFLGAHYAQDRGAGVVRVEAYGKNNEKLGEKSVQVAEWIKNEQDVFDSTKRKSYSGKIELPQQSDISRIRLFVLPGKWAVVVNDMSISFE